MQFLGQKIEYSDIQKRWFVLDYDYELGWVQIGPSHQTKYAAMDWAAKRTY